MMRVYQRGSFALLALAMLAFPAHATDVVITVENLQPSDGFFFTPVWAGFHDGGFDVFDTGSAASSQLETIAETGDAGPLSELFNSGMNGDGTSRVDTVVLAPDGFGGAPVFDPGEKVSTTINVSDPGSNRYLSFTSMVIPSNDAFFGNSNPMAYEVFNADGTLAAPLTIEVRGSGIYDSGTELNNGMGAAFSAIGGDATDESMNVELHAGLDNFIGTDTVAATTIGAGIGADTLLARIQISAVPEPSSILLLGTGLVGLGMMRSRRRNG